MSGPIVPPLEVTEVDGNPSGRPITKIIVSNGDLSISGRTATIDTTGSGGTPGGADTQVQYNNAGAFGGAADFTFTGIGGTDPTLTITNSAGDIGSVTQKRVALDGGTEVCQLSTTSGDDGLLVTTGLALAGPYIKMATDSSPSELGIFNSETDGTIFISTTDGTGDITVNANGDLHLQGDSDSVILRHQSGGSVYTTTATNEDAILGITSVGTGTPRLDIQSPSNRVWALCDENKKLKIQGGAAGNTFIIDVSGAATGITFPDGTTQTTAASGGGGGFTQPGIPSGNSDVYQEWLGWSNGLQSLVGSTRVVAYQWANASTRIRPHFISKTGDLDTAYIDCSSAPTDAGTQTCTLGAYKAGTDNSVGDLKATATLSVSASGIVSAAWVAEAGEDLAVTAGELLWVGFHSTYGSSGTAAGFSMSEGSVNSQIGADFDASPQGVTAWYPSSTGAFPEPFTLGTVAGDSSHWLYMMSSIA